MPAPKYDQETQDRAVRMYADRIAAGERPCVDARRSGATSPAGPQPTIAVAQAIARALGITLDELAGDAPGWNGLWWSVWEGLAADLVRGPLDLSQRGNTVVIRPAGSRAPDLADEVLRCDGNLLAEPDSLDGWSTCATGDVSARGTLSSAGTVRRSRVSGYAWPCGSPGPPARSLDLERSSGRNQRRTNQRFT